MNFHAIDLGPCDIFLRYMAVWVNTSFLSKFIYYICCGVVKVDFFSTWVMRHWVVCLAGSDAKSHHRRALANLQSTIVEHEEQLKDMERRTVTVTTVIIYVLRTCSIDWDLHLVCIYTDWEIFLLLFKFPICRLIAWHIVEALSRLSSHRKRWLGPNPDNNHRLFTGVWRDEIILGRCKTMMIGDKNFCSFVVIGIVASFCSFDVSFKASLSLGRLH